ncbi:MAG: hypothetical protein E7503_06375 [Ruminococcus sp.]|nr:hypothetical protein [Ruminococcus sp.]
MRTNRILAALMSAAMLTAAAAAMPVQAESSAALYGREESYPSGFYLQNIKNTLYRQVDAYIADGEVLAALEGFRGESAMLYCTEDTPDYGYWLPNNKRIPLTEVFVVDQLGSSVTAVIGDCYGADFSVEAIQAVAEACFDDSYRITITENAENGQITCKVWDVQCREEMIAAGQSFYEALTAEYTLYTCEYLLSSLRIHRIFCAGAFYALEQYPDAKAELEAFAAAYAPDWYVAEYEGFVQLTPTDHTVDNAGHLAMAAAVHEQLGYEMYIESRNRYYGYSLRDSNTLIHYITENVQPTELSAMTLSDYTLWQGDDAFLIRPQGAENVPLYVTDAYIEKLDGSMYSSANLVAGAPTEHIISNGCMTYAGTPYESDSVTMKRIEDIARSIFDDTYIIENEAAGVIPLCNHLVIRDPLMRDDITEKAMALCKALAQEHNFRSMTCWEGVFSVTGLQPSQETCLPDSFASYRYEAFPDAAEALTAFAEAYAPDWYVRELTAQDASGALVPVGAYLCPKTTDALRPYGTVSQQLDMAQLVYETLGYRVAAVAGRNTPYLEEAAHDISGTVERTYAGDADLSGKVDTTDAISALQSYVDVDLLGNAGELTQLRRKLVDCNGDGTVTPEDVIDILRIYTAGLG